ncbi:hypothetical protein Tco_0058747 [Tanacetum coccineum]
MFRSPMHGATRERIRRGPLRRIQSIILPRSNIAMSRKSHQSMMKIMIRLTSSADDDDEGGGTPQPPADSNGFLFQLQSPTPIKGLMAEVATSSLYLTPPSSPRAAPPMVITTFPYTSPPLTHSTDTSPSNTKDRPEVTLPPQKRLGIALGPAYEVKESSSAAAARPAGLLRADYGFFAAMDREIRGDPRENVG